MDRDVSVAGYCTLNLDFSALRVQQRATESPVLRYAAPSTLKWSTPFFTAATVAPSLTAFPQCLRRLRHPSARHVPGPLVTKASAVPATRPAASDFPDN